MADTPNAEITIGLDSIRQRVEALRRSAQQASAQVEKITGRKRAPVLNRSTSLEDMREMNREAIKLASGIKRLSKKGQLFARLLSSPGAAIPNVLKNLATGAGFGGPASAVYLGYRIGASIGEARAQSEVEGNKIAASLASSARLDSLRKGAFSERDKDFVSREASRISTQTRWAARQTELGMTYYDRISQIWNPALRATKTKELRDKVVQVDEIARSLGYTEGQIAKSVAPKPGRADYLKVARETDDAMSFGLTQSLIRNIFGQETLDNFRLNQKDILDFIQGRKDGALVDATNVSIERRNRILKTELAKRSDAAVLGKQFLSSTLEGFNVLEDRRGKEWLSTHYRPRTPALTRD